MKEVSAPIGKTRITRSIEVKAPIELVFDTVSNLEKYMELGSVSSTEIKVERVTKGEISKGTTWLFRATLWGRQFEWNSQVTEWDPPRRFVSEQTGPGPFKSASWEHRLSPSKGKKGLVKDILTVRYELSESIADKAGEVRNVLGSMYGQLAKEMKRSLESRFGASS